MSGIDVEPVESQSGCPATEISAKPLMKRMNARRIVGKHALHICMRAINLNRSFDIVPVGRRADRVTGTGRLSA